MANEITADTITDEQIRALREASRASARQADGPIDRMRCFSIRVECNKALHAKQIEVREKARARCAAILNARAKDGAK